MYIILISSSDKWGIHIICFTESDRNAPSFHYISLATKGFKLSS